MSRPSLILAFQHTPRVMKKLEENFQVVQGPSGSLTSSEIISLAQKHQASAILVSVNHRIHGDDMRALPASVKIIATSSVGFDHLDRVVAKEKGITLTNTPDVLSNATADLAMTHLLVVSRRMREYMKVMQDGWTRAFGQSEMLGVSLQGKTLGIFGMGSIGQQLANRARAFGMSIAYCNRHRLNDELEAGARYFSSIQEMLPHCDAVALFAPATPETHHIINAETLALMKKGSIFINVARGALVDEDALIAALKSGHLFGAGLDVFDQEPGFERRFLEFPNVYLTPHMGSATVEARDAMGLLAVDNILAVLAGKQALTPVV